MTTAEKSTLYFRKPEELHLFDPAMASILTVLNNGRMANLGAASVHASRKGYAIKFQGKTLATGKTGRELSENFIAAVEKAMKQK